MILLGSIDPDSDSEILATLRWPTPELVHWKDGVASRGMLDGWR